jgi:hypothetical protein
MTNAPYDTKPGHFPYCTKHNRLYISALAMWLTPVYPQKLQTFQALCDECRTQPQTLYVHQTLQPR